MMSLRDAVGGVAISHKGGDSFVAANAPRNDTGKAILCFFVRAIAHAALLQSSYFGGKENRAMARPVGFR
jgi:hypothetical protein